MTAPSAPLLEKTFHLLGLMLHAVLRVFGLAYERVELVEVRANLGVQIRFPGRWATLNISFTTFCWLLFVAGGRNFVTAGRGLRLVQLVLRCSWLGTHASLEQGTKTAANILKGSYGDFSDNFKLKFVNFQDKTKF